MQTIATTIITTALSTTVGAIIGYLLKKIKDNTVKDNVQSKALRDILKSNLVNQYYVYYKIGVVPRFVKESWYSMYESYVNLGGNSFVKDEIEPKWAKLGIED